MRVLFVDDDALARSAVRRMLSARFVVVTVLSAASAHAGIDLFDRERPEILVLDLRLRPDCHNDTSGLDVLRHARRSGHTGPAFVISGLDSKELRAAALDAGATDYVVKDHFGAELLASHVATAPHREPEYPPSNLVGTSTAMATLRKKMWNAARATPLPPVLISGPTGAGKEVIARTLYEWSDRRRGEFVSVNSATLALPEAALFGHERGAFTGAAERRPGLFELAVGGVLFFDEIGDLPLEHQAKLLRVLETRRFRPVGGADERTSDAWIIAATHVNLQERAREGRFRGDLLYRLDVVALSTPSLAERPEDIVPLAMMFAERATPPITFTDDAIDWLTAQPWEGNVRSLRSLVERIAVFVKTRPVDVGDLISVAPSSDRKKGPAVRSTFARIAADVLELGGNLPSNMKAIEEAAIEQTLREHGNNRTAAGRALGMKRMSVARRSRRG